jgi:hypothetical protein
VLSIDGHAVAERVNNNNNNNITYREAVDRASMLAIHPCRAHGPLQDHLFRVHHDLPAQARHHVKLVVILLLGSRERKQAHTHT